MADEEMTPERWRAAEDKARDEPYVEPNINAYAGSPNHERAIWHEHQANAHAIHAREAFLDGDEDRMMHHQERHDFHQLASVTHSQAMGGAHAERVRPVVGRLNQQYQDRWGGSIGVVPNRPPAHPEGYGY